MFLAVLRLCRLTLLEEFLGPAKPTYYPYKANVAIDVLYIGADPSTYYVVHVSIMCKSPVIITVSWPCSYTAPHRLGRSANNLVGALWHASSCLLPERVPLDTVQQVLEAVALFNIAIVTAIELSFRRKPELTPTYQRVSRRSNYP